jgi:hypothetical protein
VPVATLHRDPGGHHNGGVEKDLDTLLKELADHAAAVKRAEKTAEEHRTAIRELLPAARTAGAGPAKLERTIGSVFVAGTISRWTKDVAKPRGKSPK